MEHFSTGTWDIKILIWSVFVSGRYFATFDELLVHIANFEDLRLLHTMYISSSFSFLPLMLGTLCHMTIKYSCTMSLPDPFISSKNTILCNIVHLSQHSINIHLCTLLWWNNINTYFKSSDGKYLASDQ